MTTWTAAVHRRAVTALVAAASVLVLAACSPARPPSTPSTPAPSTTPTAASSSSAAGPDYYVSIGDSYAAGYQPAHAGAQAGTSRTGFAYRVASTLGTVTLANFGCVGATTTSALHTAGCAASALGPGATPYSGMTQIAAATQFLTRHRGHVRLVTIVLGGNDLTACGDPTVNTFTTCAAGAIAGIGGNLSTIVASVRKAAGNDTVIVGLTYPDILLALYLKGSTADQQGAQESITLFRTTVNPLLQKIYAAENGVFADVTAATGAYGSATARTDYGTFGSIPTPVARLCTLTFMCSQTDVHPTDAGYQVIADTVVTAFRHA